MEAILAALVADLANPAKLAELAAIVANAKPVVAEVVTLIGDIEAVIAKLKALKPA